MTGGVSRGAIHFGRLDFAVDADLEKLVGWTGGRFFAKMYEICGRGLSRNYIHNLATISEIEALPDTRLYNAYFEQSFYKNALSIRVGQQAADAEFFDSQTDDLFINGTFAIKATNLPAGGPAPPIVVPGIRIKAAVADKITVFAAVFNGTNSSPGPADPQLRDNHGLAFRVNDPPWMIGHRTTISTSAAGRLVATSRREAGIISAPSTISVSLRRDCRSPTPAEPVLQPSRAAISGFSQRWSRPSTGRHQCLTTAFQPRCPASPRSAGSPIAHRIET